MVRAGCKNTSGTPVAAGLWRIKDLCVLDVTNDGGTPGLRRSAHASRDHHPLPPRLAHDVFLSFPEMARDCPVKQCIIEGESEPPGAGHGFDDAPHAAERVPGAGRGPLSGRLTIVTSPRSASNRMEVTLSWSTAAMPEASQVIFGEYGMVSAPSRARPAAA